MYFKNKYFLLNLNFLIFFILNIISINKNDIYKKKNYAKNDFNCLKYSFKSLRAVLSKYS